MAFRLFAIRLQSDRAIRIEGFGQEVSSVWVEGLRTKDYVFFWMLFAHLLVSCLLFQTAAKLRGSRFELVSFHIEQASPNFVCATTYRIEGVGRGVFSDPGVHGVRSKERSKSYHRTM